MNRWINARAAGLGLALGCALPIPALAQVTLGAEAVTDSVIRQAPTGVLPARMVVTLPPQITLNGVVDRLSPGARIRDTRNLMALSGTLAGQNLPVVYRRDAAGLVHEVWLLTEAEYAKLMTEPPTPGNPEALKAFFDLLSLIFAARL